MRPELVRKNKNKIKPTSPEGKLKNAGNFHSVVLFSLWFMIKWCLNSPMSSSSFSSSLRVARGEVLIHSLAASVLAVVEDRAVKATSAALENCRREGKGTERGGRGGRQGRSQGGG